MSCCGRLWYPLGFNLNSDDIDDEWMPVTDFLEKPVDFQVLKTKVTALLGQAAAQTSGKKVL